MVKAMINGALGTMGKVLISMIANTEGIEVVCGYDKEQADIGGIKVYNNYDDIKEDIDVIIDFSHFSVIPALCKFCEKRNIPLVCATTGLSSKEENALNALSEKTAVFKTGNFSYGINVLTKLVKLASELLADDFDLEIIEKHHNKKVDAPSGTAKMLLKAAEEGRGKAFEVKYGRSGNDCKRKKNDLTIHSIRGGSIVGEHIALFAGEDEIIEIKHEASSKKIFAFGAIKAAKFLADKPKGFYDMKDM